MFIKVNDSISLTLNEIVLILDKESFKLRNDSGIFNRVEVVDYLGDDEEDIKTYIITRYEDDLEDKGIAYRLYKSTKSSLSLLNRYNKLEE